MLLRCYTPLPFALLQPNPLAFRPICHIFWSGLFWLQGTHTPQTRSRQRPRDSHGAPRWEEEPEFMEKETPPPFLELRWLAISACVVISPALANDRTAAWIPLSWELISNWPRASVWSWSQGRGSWSVKRFTAVGVLSSTSCQLALARLCEGHYVPWAEGRAHSLEELCGWGLLNGIEWMLFTMFKKRFSPQLWLS